VAGEKVTPREVEEMLLRHPAVAEAAVAGAKNPSRGEMVVAFVVPRENATASPDEIRSFCREQGMATFKVPRHVIVVRELPRSPTGKVLKRALLDQFAADAHEPPEE